MSDSGLNEPLTKLRPRAGRPLGKTGQVHRLMEMVEERFGIYPSPHVERKLGRVLSHTLEDSLRIWVDSMVELPPSDREWLSLVENLTVHETYFYRDKPMMWMLGGDILPMLIDHKRRKQDHTLKVWSAGCSTGEEAYNLVFLMLQALAAWDEASASADGEIRPKPHWRLEMLGTDVSRQVIHTAKNAVYADSGMGPLRDLPAAWLSYFEKMCDVADPLPGVDYYRIKPFIRRHASFCQHNLLSGQPPATGLDLIICRNVMIYFQDGAKREVQELLYRALAPGGVLIMGGTDVQLLPECYEEIPGDGGAWYIKK